MQQSSVIKTMERMDREDYPYVVSVTANHTSPYWNWCVANMETGTWKAKMGFMGNTEVYCFRNESDLLVFKIRWGL